MYPHERSLVEEMKDKPFALVGVNSDRTIERAKKAIAENFGVFNKMYTAVPSASSPNHLFTQSATSCGMQHNGLYNDCAPSARASRPRPLRRPLPPLDGLWLSHTRSELCGQPLSRRARPSALKPVSTRGCAAQASARM